MASFKNVPAVVSAFLNEVNLFETILAHVSSPQVAVLPVKRETPKYILQSVSPDLPFGAPGANKGIIRRYVVPFCA